MKDQDHNLLEEAYSNIRETQLNEYAHPNKEQGVEEGSGSEGGVPLHKPTGEYERLVDYLIQKGHGEIEAKELARGFLKHRMKEDTRGVEEGSMEAAAEGIANLEEDEEEEHNY